MCMVFSLLTVLGYSYVTEIRPHTRFSMTCVDREERKRTTRSSVRWLFLPYQLPRDITQAGRSNIRTVKGIPACKQRWRTLSCKSRAATTAEQRESHHGDFHGCSTSMHVSQAIDWNAPRAKTSVASRGHHTCRLTLEPCRTTTSHVQCASTTRTNLCRISSSRWPRTSERLAMQASSTVAAHVGSSSSPMGTRRHGRRGRRTPSTEKLEPSRNFYVTVMKRSDDPETIQAVLDPVFDVESDGDLENRWSLCRF